MEQRVGLSGGPRRRVGKGGTATGVQMRLTPPRRQPHERIVLHLPQSSPLAGSPQGVGVALRSDQKKRCDFPTVVRLYREIRLSSSQRR